MLKLETFIAYSLSSIPVPTGKKLPNAKVIASSFLRLQPNIQNPFHLAPKITAFFFADCKLQVASPFHLSFRIGFV